MLYLIKIYRLVILVIILHDIREKKEDRGLTWHFFGHQKTVQNRNPNYSSTYIYS